MQMESPSPSPSQAERPASSSTSSLMDPSLYEAAMKGMSDVLKQSKDQLEVLVSPNNNTVLHIAAQFGKLECVRDILEICPVICDRLNSSDETPLHVAAREGHSDIVRALIEHAEDEERGHGVGAANGMLMLANKDKDTALHEAVRNHHAALVELLIKEAPELSHMANEAEETPLYLAAERGYHELVSLILTNCTSPAYGGPFGRTALHAAAIHNNSYIFRGLLSYSLEECMKELLDWNKALLKEADIYGWMPLHYAARCGFYSSVRQLLNKDKSVANLTTNEDDEKKTALHIAATQGHVDVIEVLISQCPGCWEMVNSRGQNIFHIAVENEKRNVIEFILENSSLNSLRNQKDAEGKTPLHLLATSNCYLSKLTDNNTFNKKNMNPLDIASYFGEVDKDSVKIKLEIVGALLGWENKKKRGEREMVVPRDIRKAADTHLIVAALVATVSFAAGFTVPGGFDGKEGPDQGLAILTGKVAFQEFVITDATAMMLSTCAIFLYFAAANSENKRQLEKYLQGAQLLTLGGMLVAMIAFTTGMYAVLSHSTWLAITQCVIGVGGLFFTYAYSGLLSSHIWIVMLILSKVSMVFKDILFVVSIFPCLLWYSIKVYLWKTRTRNLVISS